MNDLNMRHILLGNALLLLAGVTNAAPTVYTDEAAFLADLAALGGATVYESFEDGVVWADSRNSISSPGSTPSVTSQGLVWTSNYLQNNLATGTVGGSAPDGAYAIYSLPHGLTTDSGLYCDSAEDPDIPIQCYQNDGLLVQSENGGALHAFGGRIDTANSGKVTFLLDGVDINGNDTDNIDNWQREGDWADNWTFVGVIDPDGFSSVELRELRGKDFQQVLLFSDDFIIGRSNTACDNGLDDDGDGLTDFAGLDTGCTSPTDPSENSPLLPCDDGVDNDSDGRVDFDPATYANPGDANNAPAGVGDPGCWAPSSSREDPQCQDGIDNDGDGGIDYDAGRSANGFADPAGPDPQCGQRTTPFGPFFTETAIVRGGFGCGLGFELVFLLPPLAWLCRRRKRP